MEEAGAKLTMPVPVAGRVQAETADTDDDSCTESWTRQAGGPDHGSSKASHLDPMSILLDPRAHPTKRPNPRSLERRARVPSPGFGVRGDRGGDNESFGYNRQPEP